MTPVTMLSLGRISVGVASLVKPDLVASRLTGNADGSPLLTQWFGSREIAIGLATLAASGAARRNLVLIGVAVDAADAATAYAGVGAQQIPRDLGMAATGVAAIAALAGLAGLRVRTSREVVVAP